MRLRIVCCGITLALLLCGSCCVAQDQGAAGSPRGPLDPDANFDGISTTRAAFLTMLRETDGDLAQLETQMDSMRPDSLDVNYQDGKTIELTRSRCLMDINYTRKSIAHILQKDSLRVEVQLALLLESTNGSVDGFGLLLQNLSTSQHGETIQKVLDWDKTLIEFRVKGAFRDSRLLSYVLARVERADKLAGR